MAAQIIRYTRRYCQDPRPSTKPRGEMCKPANGESQLVQIAEEEVTYLTVYKRRCYNF